MLEKRRVFGGEHGAHGPLRDLTQRHRAALEKVFAVVGGEQRRVEPGLAHRTLGARQPDHLVAIELDDQEVAATVGARAGKVAAEDRHLLRAGAESPRLELAFDRGRVVEIGQPAGERLGRQSLAGKEPERTRVEARRLHRGQGDEVSRKLPVGPDVPERARSQQQPGAGEELGQQPVTPPQGQRKGLAERALRSPLRHPGIVLVGTPGSRDTRCTAATRPKTPPLLKRESRPWRGISARAAPGSPARRRGRSGSVSPRSTPYP